MCVCVVSGRGTEEYTTSSISIPKSIKIEYFVIDTSGDRATPARSDRARFRAASRWLPALDLSSVSPASEVRLSKGMCALSIQSK